MTAEQAEKEPAGKAREEPQPLDKPNRPDTSFGWLMSPFKSIQYLICQRYRCLLIKLVILILLLLLICLFIYSAPGIIMEKLLG